MILSDGTLHPSEQSAEVLARLDAALGATLARPPLEAETVVDACGRFVARLGVGEYDALLAPLRQSELLRPGQLEQAVALLSPDSLRRKLAVELGEPCALTLTPPGGGAPASVRRMPLGVLFHIAAGNVEALPAYSVIEGLLGGNVNLLKLPSADDGLSVRLLHELVTLEPRLAPYVHVFDTPSSDLATLQAMAGLCHAIVVWGGDEAVAAARRLAPPNVKLIEWGHKLSFAYVTPEGATDAALAGLARHVFETEQLLCSSCQGLFLDTEDEGEVEALAERFLPILEEAGRRYARRDAGTRAWVTLRQHSERLAELATGQAGRRRAGAGCSLLPGEDGVLTLSPLYGSLWVRPLPRARLVEQLWRHRRHLQTAGLLCRPDEWDELAALLAAAGVTRVTTGAAMSLPLVGGGHDGEYPLQRYTRVVEVG